MSDEKKHYHRGRRHTTKTTKERAERPERMKKEEPEEKEPYLDLAFSEEDLYEDDYHEDGYSDLPEDDDDFFRTAEDAKSIHQPSGKQRRGSQKRAPEKKKGRILSNIILILAIIVFCVSAFQLFRIMSGYYKGQKEYDHVRELAIDNKKEEDGEEQFRVNFDELMKINPDTVGWIRFSPEPAQINYPIVQTDNNDTYLNKTFSANDNTVGAIFVNAYNRADFSDKNTIIYGHRMNDNSMFHDLAKYEDKAFWEKNPYFYIYTPDGREITYHIYSAGVVTDTSDTYLTEFATPEAYQAYLDYTKQASAYDTGVEVTLEDTVVTLSTCTKASDEHRMVVVGVKESEKKIN